MLRKLMKHEFRATGRIMLPLFALLLVTALGANLSIRGLMDSENDFLNFLGGLLMVAFVVAMAAVCLVSFALMVQRFYKNLLRDEGYVMMTLPVSAHHHLWSKLIVSTVWFAATILVVILSCCVMAFDIRVVRELWDVAGTVFRMVIQKHYLSGVLNGVLACVEFLILCVCGSFGLCLQFYAAMAVGFSFPQHKGVYSVVMFIVMNIMQSLLSSLLIGLFNDSWLYYFLLGWTDYLSATAGMHLSIWLLIGSTLIDAAIFYVLTVYFLQKRLDLE